MGFCLSCGDLASTPRCPRCKGKVSGITALGLSNRDAWSATYLNQTKKGYSPNLEKLTNNKCLDRTLPEIEVSGPETDIKSEPVISTPKILFKKHCEKCSNEIVNKEDSFVFQSKSYHKSCLQCSFCSNFLDVTCESEGQACCKSCSESLLASSHSSPILKTPENESLDSFPLSNNSNFKAPDTNLINDLQIKSSARNKTNVEPNIALVSEKLSSLNLKTRLTGTQELPTHSPVYSRTFQQLQATVNNKLAPSPSIRNRPRKVSEGANGLSFADLLASRRNPDSKATISRRPVSILGVESINKRSSLSIPKAAQEKETSATTELNNPIRGHRLSLSRPRPTSFNLGDKRPEFNFSSNRIIPSQDKTDNINIQSSQPKPFSTNLTSSESTNSQKVEDNKSKDTSSQLSNKNTGSGNSSSSEDSPATKSSSKLACNHCDKAIGLTWFKLPDGRIFHKECFKCHHCQKPIEDGKYSVANDLEYHTQCLSELTANSIRDDDSSKDICDKCHKSIKGSCFTLSNGNQYHPECFICAGCKKIFEQGTYVSHDNKEFHKECVPQQESLPCAKCKNPIRGVFVTNNSLNYHSDCFRCTGCDKNITPKTPFGEFNQQHYCEPCLIKQYTPRPSSFAVSAAQKEQRHSPSTFRS